MSADAGGTDCAIRPVGRCKILIRVHLRSSAAKYSCLRRQPGRPRTPPAPAPPDRAPPAIRPSQGAPTPASTTPFKPFRTDPLNREPTAKPGPTVPFKPSRTDPLNREPATKPDTTAPFKPSRTNLLNSESAVPPNPRYFTPTPAAAMPRHAMPHAPRRSGRRTTRPPLRHRRVAKPAPPATTRTPREPSLAHLRGGSQ